jgi:hypothetical protein
MGHYYRFRRFAFCSSSITTDFDSFVVFPFPDDAISCDRLSLSRDRSLFVYPTNNTAPCQSSKVVAKAKHLETDEDKMP